MSTYTLALQTKDRLDCQSPQTLSLHLGLVQDTRPVTHGNLPFLRPSPAKADIPVSPLPSFPPPVLTIASGFLPSVSPSLLSSLCYQTGSLTPSFLPFSTGKRHERTDTLARPYLGKTTLTTKFDRVGKFHRVTREKYLLRGVVLPTRWYPPTLSTATTVTVAVQRSERLAFLKL